MLTVAELEAEHFLEEEENEREMRWQMAIAKASKVHAEMRGRRFSPIPSPPPNTAAKVPSTRRKTTGTGTAHAGATRRSSFQNKSKKLWMTAQYQPKRRVWFCA